jgi:ubiquinone/menaquinone biosynthesis C-methylase UbiE
MREEKKSVRTFYDGFAWEKENNGLYKDTKIFVDNRPVMALYGSRVHRRVGRFINPRGKYLLDAASGAIPFKEYLDYSQGYHKRVCVDFSLAALKEAQNKLGEKGLYILADVTQLPFRKGVFDGIISLHTIYHIPANEQKSTFEELMRLLKKEGKLVIVTILPYANLTKILVFCRALLSKAIRVVPIVNRLYRHWREAKNKIQYNNLKNNAKSSANSFSSLYCFPREIGWWKTVLKEYKDSEIRIWRTIDAWFSKNIIPNNIVGRIFLLIIYFLELIAPHIMVYLGRYPMIIVNKK